MIELTSLAQHKIWINNNLIKMIESTPDTIICFVDGSRIPVRETPKQIEQKIIQFNQQIQNLVIKD